MNWEFTVKDRDTGEIIEQGLVTDIMVSVDRCRGKSVKIEGRPFFKVTETREELIKSAIDYYSRTLPDQSRPQYFETKKTCQHEWKQYDGFMNNYQYCVHCDEKKT